MMWKNWIRPRVVIEQPGRLNDLELHAAFNVASDNKLWRAVLQVIDDVAAEAKDGAEKSVASHGICASCVGGGEFLTRLKDRMILEREAAIKQPA
jgi:hypothetical protein